MSSSIAIEEFMETVVETTTQIEQEKADVERAIGTIEALEHLQDWFSKKETISLEDINVIDAACVFSRQDKDKDFSLLPEVTEGQDVSIVLESISDRIVNGVASLAKSSTTISALMKKRWLGYSSLIGGLKGDLERIKEGLNGKSGSDKVAVNISFPVASTYAYRSSDELLKKLTEDLVNMTDVIERFNVGSEKMQNMVFKTIMSMTSPSRYDRVMVENFNIIRGDFTESILKSKLFEGNNTSKPILGDKAIYAQSPTEDLVLGQSRGVIRNAIALFDLKVIKHSKEVAQEVSVREVDLIVSVSQLNGLVSKMQKLFDAMDDYRKKENHYLDVNRTIGDYINKILFVLNTGSNLMVISDGVKKLTGLLEAFKITSPAAYTAVKTAAVGAGVAAVVGNIVMYKLLTALRKFIIGWIFTSMKLQYKVNSLVEEFDRGVIKMAVLSFNNSSKVCDKAVKKL